MFTAIAGLLSDAEFDEVDDPNPIFVTSADDEEEDDVSFFN